MSARATDTQLFYKLIRKQRNGPHNNNTQADIEFPTNIQGDTEAEKWADYFHKLATPKTLPEFDESHKRSISLQRLLISSIPQEEPPPVVSAAQISKLVRSLSNNKAPDGAGITSEHLKLASPILLPIKQGARCRKTPSCYEDRTGNPRPQKGEDTD
jgi:hypothetical protein